MKTNRRLLEFQSDRIEAVLARHKITSRVTGGKVLPRWIQFQVATALSAKVSQVKGLAEELAKGLDVDRVRVSRNGATINVEIPRPDSKIVLLPPLIERIETPPFCSAVLGLAEDGAPLVVKLPSPQVAHVLIAGTTGSGKSALAQAFITSLALTHGPLAVRFVLIDPKRDYADLGLLPHLMYPSLDDPSEAAQVLARLVELMQLRDREKVNGPRIVIAIDELVDLLMAAPEAEEPLTRIAQRGRSAGIHLLACTQKPAASVIGGLTKANFPVRLVGRVTSPEDAKVATGYAGTGAEHLLPPGDFLAVYGGHDPVRFQAAYVPPADLATLVDQLNDEHGSVESLMLPEVAEPQNPLDEALAEYVEKARPVYEALASDNGGTLPWGGKADICAAIFGERDTGGSRGKWTDRVIAQLSEDDAGQKKTTTTAPARLFLRSKRDGRLYASVVVVYRYPGEG